MKSNFSETISISYDRATKSMKGDIHSDNSCSDEEAITGVCSLVQSVEDDGLPPKLPLDEDGKLSKIMIGAGNYPSLYDEGVLFYSSTSPLIRVHDYSVPPILVDDILTTIRSRGFTYGWRSHPDNGFSHWNMVFAGAAMNNRVDVEHEIPDVPLLVWRHIQPRYMPETPVLMRCYSNAHTYGVEGKLILRFGSVLQFVHSYNSNDYFSSFVTS